MKRKQGIAKLAAAALLVGVFALIPKGETAEAAVTQLKPSTYTPMYRVYNPNSGEHFYTSSTVERNACVAAGWNDEGIGWYAPNTVLTTTTPVWRIYNTKSGEHYYSTSKAEVESIYVSTAEVINGVITPTWNMENIGWQSADATAVSQSDMTESDLVPVYVLFNPNCPGDQPGSHHYTTSAGERDALIAEGWQYDSVYNEALGREAGIAFYGVPAQDEYEKANATGSSKTVTIDQDPGYAVIEAKMKLKNTTANASGLHAKVTIATSGKNGEVASFGIQYEKDIHNAYPQYQGNTVFLLENVFADAATAGTVGKHYLYLQEASLDTEYLVRLSWTKDDNMLHCYVNDHEVSSGYAKWTVTDFAAPFTFAVEASAAHNGDQIDAEFTDIKVRVGDGTEAYPLAQGTEGTWNDTDFDFFGIDATLTNAGSKGPTLNYLNDTQPIGYNAAVTIKGTATIGDEYDWDTCFGAVEPRTGTTGHPLSGMVTIAQQQTGHPGWVADGAEGY